LAEKAKNPQRVVVPNDDVDGTCTYNRLPKDEPSGSKRVEETKN